MASITVLDLPATPGEAFNDGQGLSRLAFSRLLEWLDDGVDSGGETYVEMRRRLVSYFDRRNRPTSDELADETLNRIGKTLEKDGSIATTPPARYCYVVAKYVFLEDVRREQVHARRRDQRRVHADAWASRTGHHAHPDEDAAASEQRLERLDHCLQNLKPDQRDLIVEYYRDTGHDKIARRRDMAKRLGISMNALGIRACRIRAALEACLDVCCRDDRRD
jgi:DNA-directed RNA polymerase specialized sigma24 family protein